MPVEYEIDEDRRLVRSRAFGVLLPAELLAHIRRLADDPAAPIPLHEIWDGTAIERFEVRGADVRGFINTATTFQATFQRARLAIVMRGAAMFGLARMAQLLAELTPFRIGVFRELAPATAWMDARIAERDAAESAEAGE